MWEKQEQHRLAILENRAGEELWIVEHKPTLSLGRGEKGQNIYLPVEWIVSQGFEVTEVNRGGMVTYHGPGQLVAYPILHLQKHHLGVRDYIHLLEQSMIDTLATYGLVGLRKPGAPGIYIDNRKVGSVGIHVRKGVSIHGLALNVSPNLQHFSLIRPCGLMDMEVTSIERELHASDQVTPTFEKVCGEFIKKFNHRLA